MKYLELAFELFMLYLLYKLVFDFILPVVKTTKEVKKQFVDMSVQMQDKIKQHQQQAANVNTAAKPAKAPGKNDDYIDFEEVK